MHWILFYVIFWEFIHRNVLEFFGFNYEPGNRDTLLVRERDNILIQNVLVKALLFILNLDG